MGEVEVHPQQACLTLVLTTKKQTLEECRASMEKRRPYVYQTVSSLYILRLKLEMGIKLERKQRDSLTLRSCRTKEKMRGPIGEKSCATMEGQRG